jgi:hypothetical protein
MTSRVQARGHLAKAKEFLAVAQMCTTTGAPNAATSNAVLCGINAKDAICLALVGRTTKSDDHSSAVKELAAVSAAGRKLPVTLGRLLQMKTSSQYGSAAVGAADAKRAVRYAEELCEAAQRIVTG